MTQAVNMPDPSKANLFDYVVVFSDPRPPKEAEFSAANDGHAIELTKKEYPNQKWTLYRKAPEQQVRIHSN